MKIIIIILIASYLFSCSNRNSEINENHALANTIIKFNNLDSCLIIKQANKFIYPTYDHPPNLRKVLIKPSVFEGLKKENILSEDDINFMIDQINKNVNLDWDQIKFRNQRIDYELIDSVHRNIGLDSVYNFLKGKYNTNSFAYITKPIFSKDHSKALITIDYNCGVLCGYCNLYVCKKTDNYWKVIFSNI